MIHEILQLHTVLYVTRDIERAIGLPLDTPGYVIIANSTSFAKRIAKGNPNIVLIEHETMLDTWDLLKHPLVIASIQQYINPHIIVFKNTKQIEATCAEHGWKLLNPPASLSDNIEPKIHQIEWLGSLAHYLPSYTVCSCSEVVWSHTPFILQFNRSHTGSGTMLITSQEQLQQIQTTFPNRTVRTATYIVGPLFTNNNCVTDTDILIGNISYQITGLSPFTDREFATIGNDWRLPHTLLTETQKEAYHTMAREIGLQLQQAGWRGLFGIDVVMDAQTGTLYLLEINARQPASTSYESVLQQQHRQANQITMFEAHLCSLLHLPIPQYEVAPILDGAQIIIRALARSHRTQRDIETMIQSISDKGFSVIEYEQQSQGSDLLRVQSKTGIMHDHSLFNDYGTAIAQCVIE